MNINELYSLAINGGRAEENQLFEKLSEILRVIVGQRIWDKQDAGELVQEVLAIVAAQYKEVVIEKSFAAWVNRIAQNTIAHYYRSKQRRKNFLFREEEEMKAMPVADIDPYVLKKLKDCIKDLVAKNKRYARVLTLSYQGYTTEEICARLNISRNNVLTILCRARSLLKHCLEKGKIE